MDRLHHSDTCVLRKQSEEESHARYSTRAFTLVAHSRLPEESGIDLWATSIESEIFTTPKRPLPDLERKISIPVLLQVHSRSSSSLCVEKCYYMRGCGSCKK